MTSHRRRAVLLRAAHRSTQGAPVRCQAPLHCQTGTAAATHSSTIAPHTQPGDPTHVAVREQGRGAVVPREVGRALPRQPLPVPGQIPPGSTEASGSTTSSGSGDAASGAPGFSMGPAPGVPTSDATGASTGPDSRSPASDATGSTCVVGSVADVSPRPDTALVATTGSSAPGGCGESATSARACAGCTGGAAW